MEKKERNAGFRSQQPKYKKKTQNVFIFSMTSSTQANWIQDFKLVQECLFFVVQIKGTAGNKNETEEKSIQSFHFGSQHSLQY